MTMSRSRPLLAAVLCLIASCADPMASRFPARARPITPHPLYEVWWQMVEACAGRTGRFADLHWYEVDRRDDVIVDGQPVEGAWFSSGNRIVLVSALVSSGQLVRHEMLHALLRAGDHPPEYFRDRCGDEVTCGRTCGPHFSRQEPLTAALVTGTDLELDAWTTPDSPSISAHDGWIAVTISATNPRSSPVHVRQHWPAGCHWGYSLIPSGIAGREECIVSTDEIVYFYPGETRRVTFDLNLAWLKSVLVPGTTATAMLSARFANVSVPVRSVVIRP